MKKKKNNRLLILIGGVIIANFIFAYSTKLSGSHAKENALPSVQYEALKKNYLSDSISYSVFNSKVDELKKLNSFSEDKSVRKAIDEIEDARVIYRSAEELTINKDYKAALGNLNKIEASIDESYKNKVNNLKVQISGLALKETEAKLNEYLSKEAFENGITYLKSRTGLIPNDYITENTSKLNALIKKRNDEELKRKKAEEAKKKEIAFLAPYLKNYVPNPEREKAVSSISSRTSFLVWVNIASQETNVFVGSKGTWKLIHSFPSSTGKKSYETPTGTYTIKERGTWFFSEKYQEGAKYWVRFTGEYLFHSLPMNQDRQVVDPTLGTPASHGCVRLGIDNAAWFYNNVPVGTTVYIKN